MSTDLVSLLAALAAGVTVAVGVGGSFFSVWMESFTELQSLSMAFLAVLIVTTLVFSVANHAHLQELEKVMRDG